MTAELKDVTAWFDLGLKLGIEHSVLKRIESNYRHEGIERCKTEVLVFWIDNGTDVSLKKLTEALEEINHRNLARHLQEKYNVPQTGTTSRRHRGSAYFGWRLCPHQSYWLHPNPTTTLNQ